VEISEFLLSHILREINCVEAQCRNFMRQILRETNLGDSISVKSAIFTHLEALNSDFNEFLHFSRAEIDQINKIQSLKNGKNSSWASSLLDCPKLISRKI